MAEENAQDSAAQGRRLDLLLDVPLDLSVELADLKKRLGR